MRRPELRWRKITEKQRVGTLGYLLVWDPDCAPMTSTPDGDIVERRQKGLIRKAYYNRREGKWFAESHNEIKNAKYYLPRTAGPGKGD